MESLEERFEQNLTHCNVRNGQKIVLGVSGGVDSVVMTDLFLRSPRRLQLIIAHLNHGVRKEAQSDEKFVEKLAKEHNLTFISEKLLPIRGGNLEEEMRIRRREFLERVAGNHRALFVALAHNSNDQAETFFLNVLRGSSPAGLGAMEMSSNKIIRPLLNFSRKEIEQYAKDRTLLWQVDQSNYDVTYSRNYLRHKVFPLFREINPNWLEAFYRTSYLQRKVDNYLKKEAVKFIKEELDVTKIQRLDKPILYEILGLLYEQAKGDRKDLALKNLQDLEILIASTSGTKSLNLPNKITAIRRYNILEFEAKIAYNGTPQTKLDKLEMGDNYFGRWNIKLDQVNGLGSNSKYHICLDENILSKIKVRTWQTGDKITTFGITGTKKLQDLFVDAKIDREKRYSWPVFVLGKEVVWVPQIALSRNFSSGVSPKIKIVAEE